MSIALTTQGQPSDQIINIENDGSGNPLFVGWAPPGTANADEGWLIIQVGYTGGFLTSTRFAGGEAKYRFVWDDRAGYVYS